jgi:hypothetical protein
VQLFLTNGELAQLLEHAGSQAVLRLPMPVPPGSPIAMRTESGMRLQIKVNRCQKLAEGEGYRVDARWVSLSRVDRAALEQALAEGPTITVERAAGPLDDHSRKS